VKQNKGGNMGKLVINTYYKKGRIHKNIYGHFTEHLGYCIYEGIYVGEDSDIPNKNGMRKDVVGALKKIHVPVLRWPGGNFADEYHWMDGIGARSQRKKLINTHWGGQVEDNSFGTHEFFELCSQIGCEPYVNINVGSGSIKEMQQWIEYMTFAGASPMADLRRKNGREEPWEVRFIGIGNENWDCGGSMKAEYYADVYKNFQTYIRNYGNEPIYKIACGPLAEDYHWTDTLMREAGHKLDALALHYYTYPGINAEGQKGESIHFSQEEWYNTIAKSLKMEEMIRIHTGIMQRYDPQGKVSLVIDEWGNWYNAEPGTNPGFLFQQNTMRDAVTAAVNLNIFNQYCGRISMANIAQMVNVLQAIILTEGEKMILTPTYYVYNMYQHHQDSMLLESYLETEEIGMGADMVPNLHHSVSQSDDGTVNLTIANLSADEGFSIDAILVGKAGEVTEARMISGAITEHNTFKHTENICERDFEDYAEMEDGVKLQIPPSSVILIRIKERQGRENQH